MRLISLPMLLVHCGLLVWAPLRAHGQAFGINQIANLSVSVGTPLAIQVSVTDSNIPPSLLNFTLASNRPNTDATNAAISLNYGVFTWTPAQTEVVTFTVTALSLSTLYQTSTNFTVTVTNSVTPVSQIVIDLIPPQTVAEGTLLTFTSTAHATDNPASPLFFRLLNPPAGASMTNNSLMSGLFTWTPTTAQAATPFYTIREVVTELSTLATNYQDFQVTVTLTNNCEQYADFLAAVAQGGYFLLTNCSTIVLTNTLTISKDVVLDGGSSGVTIAGNNLVRLFTVLPGANLTLYGLTLQGGSNTSGGAIYISSGGGVLMTNCVLTGNSAVGTNGTAGTNRNGGGNTGQNGGNGTAGTAAWGGAIYNLGSLVICNSQFLTNSARGSSGGSGGGGGDGVYQGGNGGNGGAGALGYGGAIYNLGTLALTNCTFSGNTATGGSGGSGGTNGDGAFEGNAGSGGAGASGSGAAVYSGQSVIAVNCTFASNAAQSGSSADGGTGSSGNGVNGPSGPASFGGGVFSQGSGTFVNCTFYNNTAAGGNGGDGGPGSYTGGNGGNGGNGVGGGLYNTGTVAVVNCTFSGCGATGGTNGVAGKGAFSGSNGGPGRGLGGDIAQQGSGTFALRNTILAASSAGTNAYDTSASRITDGGYNISSDASLNLSGTSLKNTDPLIGSLADNGGPTQTIALQTNSPALNRIPPALGPATDQRGVPRPQPQGAASDIGAYELVTVPAVLSQPQSRVVSQGGDATFTVYAFGDSLTYQWCFNGTDISGATLSAYTLSNAQATNTGDYDVVLTDNYGSVTSLTAVLAVYPFTMSGQVFDVTGTNPLPGVLIQVTNSVFASSTNTDDNGQFVILGLDSNTLYTVVPSLPCYFFSPASTNVSVELANVTGLTFFATNDFHSVSGVISNGPAGVALTVSGSNGTTTVTSGAGVYGVSNLCAGFYFVVPSLPGYQFLPPTNSILVPPDANAVNFTAVQIFSIGGQITQGTNGPGLGGISVAITGPIVTNVTTGADGSYLLGGLQAGIYQVTPAVPGCNHLNLPSRLATLGPNASGVDFVALPDAYRISGHLTNGTAGVSGIMVSAGGTNVTLTDTTGLYVFSNLCSGSYTVTPSASCYVIAPTSRMASVGPGDVNGVDFGASAQVYTLSGRITESGAGVSNITVQAGNQTTNTDPSGNYVLSGLCPGSYTVIPGQGCRLFNPASVPVTLGPNASEVNFNTFSNNLSRIRGQITDGVSGLSNVLVITTGAGTALTDANGNYAFSSLCPGTYTVTPSLTNFCFNIPSLTVALGSAQTTNGVNFVATPGQYHISGTVAGMPPGPQVAVSIAGPSGTSVLITSTGAYGISNLCPGAYSVTLSNACFQFYPLSWTTTVGPSDDSLDFAVSGGGAFSIGGQVTTYNGVGLSNVVVVAAGQTNVTDASGNYIFPYLCPGVYAVTASALNFQFNPATNYVTLSSADSNGVNFAAFQVASLSGRVVQGASGLPGVKVSAGTSISFTGAGGYYTNLNLSEGTNVLVVPSLGGYAFAPSAQSLVVLSNTSLPDFMAFPSLALAQTANGASELTFAPGFTCQVLASGDLSHWQPVLTTNNVSTNTPLLQFTDSDAVNLPLRFYRVRQTFAAPPALMNVVITDHSVSLGCVAAPVLACQIYASTNLTSWVSIFSTNLPAAAPFQFRYDEATNLPARFYRLSQTPGF